MVYVIGFYSGGKMFVRVIFVYFYGVCGFFGGEGGIGFFIEFIINDFLNSRIEIWREKKKVFEE